MIRCVGVVDPEPTECVEPMLSQVDTNDYCGLLQDISGPFADCIRSIG